MSIFNKFVNNTSRPEGFLGKLMVKGMNSGHTKVSMWGIGYIPDRAYRSILDIGCGGGMNIKRFAERYLDARLVAVDHSDIAIEKTQKLNRDVIGSGRLQVLKADVSNLPFEKEKFDLVTAFETVYFWPNLEEDFRGVYDILKPNGFFAIVNELNERNKEAKKWTDIIEGMTVYNRDELTRVLEKVGFRNIQVHTENQWICIIGEK